MSRVCILTDSTVQFTQPTFRGHHLVYVIPCELKPISQQDVSPLAMSAYPQQLIPPTHQHYIHYFTQLAGQYDSILVLTMSGLLSHAAKNAQKAAEMFGNHAWIQVFDSLTTAVGLGLLVQKAAEIAEGGACLKEIEECIRAVAPHVYMLLCIPELVFLAQAGYLTHAQALVGEILGLLPIFILEEGRLVPLDKVRTHRHLFESFQEFVNEFEQLSHIALLRGVNNNTLRTRPFREFIQDSFPQATFCEQTTNPYLAALFGPQSICLVIQEELRGVE